MTLQLFLFHLTVALMALIISIFSFFGILAIIKHRRSKVLPLFWGISLVNRKSEVKLITISVFLFAISFIFSALYWLSNYYLYFFLFYVFGILSYGIAGYVVSSWAFHFKRLV